MMNSVLPPPISIIQELEGMFKAFFTQFSNSTAMTAAINSNLGIDAVSCGDRRDFAIASVQMARSSQSIMRM